MITLIRDNIVMEVATELQASVFLRSGYKRVDKAPSINITAEQGKAANTTEQATTEPETVTEAAPMAGAEPVPPVNEKPKRGRRPKKTVTE